MKCLIVFSHDSHWIDFRYAELDALLLLCNLDPLDVYSKNSSASESVFQLIDLPDFQIAQKICERSVLIKAIYEFWCFSSRLSDLFPEIKKISSSFLDKCVKSLSWSIHVETFFRTLTSHQKEQFRNKIEIDYLSENPVSLVEPQIPLWLLLDYSQNKHIAAEECHIVPAYFGRLLAKVTMRDIINKMDLKKRLYLGPTSLDHSLALILSNLARIRRYDLVLDPFVGTASILVALTHFGAKCFGTDIDTRVLHGNMYAGKADRTTDKTKRNIQENFLSYGLEVPELIRLDNHLLDRHVAKKCTGGDGLFDAIVTDPPYGIRAGAKKSGKKDFAGYSMPINRPDHIPATQHYPVEEVMLDLLHTAASLLVLGGRLVYLIPTTYDFVPSDLPRHPCLELQQTCEQSLSSRHGRRAVVMYKVSGYSQDYRLQFADYKASVLAGQDEGFGLLIDKLRRALSPTAFEDVDVEKRTSNGFLKRKQRKIQALAAKRAGKGGAQREDPSMEEEAGEAAASDGAGTTIADRTDSC